MKKKYLLRPTKGKYLLVVLSLLLLCIVPNIVFAADDVDPEADRILRAMSNYFAETDAFSMNADIGNEIITYSGQKLQLNSVSKIVMARPNKFLITRKGMFADLEMIYDGKLLTLYGGNLNVYAQHQVDGSADDAIRAVEIKMGLDAPGADLLFSDPYAILSPGVVSSAYLGTDYVNGVECHHLAFREKKVDWQLWVQTGTTPLPMKYVITSKWQAAAPQYSVQFRDWNTKPVIKAELFQFLEKPGAKNLANIKIDALGNLVIGQEGK
ncbi:MAG: DUF2092 domain-containing protein [Desulfuromusa sp.]|nr:DUF2092 domain-containing protein [Desulfuromusa sp.]